MTNYKNILVTGGAGTIGLELVKILAKNNFRVTLFDLRDQISVSRKFIPKDVKVIEGSVLDKSALIKSIDTQEAVIHLAASLGVRNTEENLYRCYQINVRGTENVLDICLQKNVNKILYASSSEVYGEAEVNPIDENFPTQGKSCYAVTKMMGENLIESYNQIDKNLKFVIFRFFNTYGINQVAQFVIPRFIHAARNNKDIVINGDGMQLRSYCSAKDIAKGVMIAINNNKINNQIVNLGNSKETISIKNLARIVLEKIPSKSKIVFDKTFTKTDRNQSREIYNRIGNFTKAKKILDFDAKIKLSNGLDDFIYYDVRENWPNL